MVFIENEVNSNEPQSNEVHSIIRKTGASSETNGPSDKKRWIIIVIAFAVLLSCMMIYGNLTGLFIYQTPAASDNVTICGNSICEVWENETSCPADCKPVVITENATQTVKGGLRLIGQIVQGASADVEKLYVNDTAYFYVHVEKLGDANVSKAWVILKSPTGKLQTVELSDNGIWEGRTQVTDGAGLYLASFNAVDSSNTYAEQMAVVFMVDLDLPAITTVIFAGGSGMLPSAY
ncbi:MAG: hypothetical protein V1678_02710 [Candidatus Aenigmatarchaeota archaeon]